MLLTTTPNTTTTTTITDPASGAALVVPDGALDAESEVNCAVMSGGRIPWQGRELAAPRVIPTGQLY